MFDYERCGHAYPTGRQDGQPVGLRHNSWTPIRHLYYPPPLGQEEAGISLFRGEFVLNDQAWDGEIRFETRKHPEPLASGRRSVADLSNVGTLGLEAFFADDPGWEVPSCLSLPDRRRVPAPPVPSAVVSTRDDGTPAPGHRIAGHHVGPAELGIGDRLDRLSFLVPNGRWVDDGLSICDAGRMRFGVTVVEADGWSIRIDPRTDASQRELSKHQRETAAHTITHVGEVRRSDGSEFTSSSASDVIRVVETALSLYLGRATACVLPVGWLGAEPLWTRWGRERVIDRRESDFSWFDQADGAASLGALIRCCLKVARRSDGLWELVELAIGYLLSAHRSTVQLRVSLPVAAISLLAEEWFVSFAPSNERHSRAAMEKLGAADRIRAMLLKIGLPPDIPVSLRHLEKVQLALHGSDELAVDAVKCIVTLRNEVEHPGKRRKVQRDPREWAEAGFFATDVLLLCVLFLVGYDGTYLGLSSSSRSAGSGHRVPWAGANGAA